MKARAPVRCRSGLALAAVVLALGLRRPVVGDAGRGHCRGGDSAGRDRRVRAAARDARARGLRALRRRTSSRVRAEPVSFAPIAHGADPSVVTITTVGEEEVEVSPFTHRRRRARDARARHRLRRRQGRHHPHEQPRRRGRRRDPGEALRRARVPGARSSGPIRRPTSRSCGSTRRTCTPLPLGDSDAIDVGDWVVAIGNPFGLSHTVSAGIISAKGRTRQDVPLDPTGYYDFLQTDASINPGNSGGPLLNLRGEVVGINTAIRGGGAQGIGFAIPINMVKQLLPMLLRDGHVTRSALGVRIIDVARALARGPAARSSCPRASRITGAVVEYVAPGGPADKGGLQPGDIDRRLRGAGDRAFVAAPVAREHGRRRAGGDAPRPARGQAVRAKVTLGPLAEAAAVGPASPPARGSVEVPCRFPRPRGDPAAATPPACPW